MKTNTQFIFSPCAPAPRRIAQALLPGFLLWAAHLDAQSTRTWDGGGSTSNWNEAANWSDDVVPGNSFEAQLGNAAPETITAPNGTAQPRGIRFLDTAANDITIQLAAGSTWRLVTPASGGGVFVDGGARSQTIDLNGGKLLLGANALTGNKDVDVTNNGAGTLRFTAGSLNMSTTGAAPAGSIRVRFGGSGAVVIDSALGHETSENPATFNLSQTGSGVTTLNGANTYNGVTTVSAGVLLVNGTHTGGAAYTVNAGGTLGGAGIITTAGNAGVTVATGGRISAGSASSAGTLTLNLGTGTLDLSATFVGDSASLLFRLGAPSASDKIVLGAGTTLNIGSDALSFGDFAFSTGAGFAPGVYTLFETSASIVGSLSDGGLSGIIGGLDATLSLSGNKVLLTVAAASVPEPATTALLLGGACILFFITSRGKRRASA
ncbi:autotransporter-associated beta strand repeat-containing protein [Geminisphaera colitermitum]|uniref:autotransporter-associated beta strand repeat-containing protein n=1 Tax=Geminisphaera colitermitum TaxID=1148786 RepID=UPI000158D4C6|nr:autotransporter-associated beta strand repeat-containing protein [Geminisphaera colitermitum]